MIRYAPFVFVLLLTGCPPTAGTPCEDDTDCPDGRCRFGACGPVCEEDTDCGSRQICQSGACVARPECSQTADCASGFDCRDGTCRCTGDQACALNQSCVDGACVARTRCTGDQGCPAGQRCELTQGLCIPPCALATDCAPGVDPRLAVTLYQCLQGACYRRCLNDATCGEGLVCADGLCEIADCATRADCPEGQYCSSATFGRCLPFRTCTADAQCQQNEQCRAFDPASCPPGFPCEQTICQELPLCLIDQDCAGVVPGQVGTAAYCEDQHCQPSSACTQPSECAPGQACIANVCVPGGCRGHADCAATEACVGGACRTAPAPADLLSLAVTPNVLRVQVGGTTRLHVIGYEFGGASFPLTTGVDFTVVDVSGQPSGAAQVDPSGIVTASAPGTFRIRAQVTGSSVAAVEATLDVYPELTSGRAVVVVDASTGRPLAGVSVHGCDGTSTSAACAAPVEALTDAMGTATFPSFTGTEATFSVASAELRADGLPRYEHVSVLDATERMLLIPLGPNPVSAAAGFNGVMSFSQVHTEGNYWVGFAVASIADPVSADAQTLLGEPFQVELPGVGQRVPVPGSVVLYTSPGLGIANDVKPRSLGLAQPGRRSTVAFAGRTTLEQLLTVRSTEFLAYAGGFDYDLVPFGSHPQRLRISDTADVDGDGLCADAARCPQGTEFVPDYFNFPSVSFTPRFLQKRRTEVIVPDLPAGFDTALISAVELTSETGMVPLGFSSRAAGAPGPGGARPVEPVVLRSGAALAGVETGEPAVWLLATQAAGTAQGQTSTTGRILRGPVLPTRAVLPPLLGTAPQSTFVAGSRTFAPEQPAWNALVSAGAELARVDLVGSEVRHRVYFAAHGSQTSVRVPSPPPVSGLDPATEATVQLDVSVLDLVPGTTAQQAFSLTTSALELPARWVDGYSRWPAR